MTREQVREATASLMKRAVDEFCNQTTGDRTKTDLAALLETINGHGAAMLKIQYGERQKLNLLRQVEKAGAA